MAAGDRLVVAVSGGADSVALLTGLVGLASLDKWALDLHVGHVHHHLRDAADDEAACVASLAEASGLPLHHRDIYPADQPGNLESNARRMRYAALADVAAGIDAEAVATAHHADDQLETMLMRLVRGASPGGLAGIAERTQLVGATVVRPMLGVDHHAAVAFCEEAGQAWHEDATNADVSRWRARLRVEVLPVLRSMKPDAAIKASDAARRLRRVDRVTRSWTRRLLARHARRDESGWRIDRAAARRLKAELLRWLVRAAALHAGCPADRLNDPTLERIVAAARDDNGETRRFELSGGVGVEVAPDAIRLSPSP